MITRKILLFSVLSLFFILLKPDQAKGDSPSLPTITVVNMIRGNALGRENENLLPRLQAQWEDTKSHNIPATWLWQYDALTNRDLTLYAKKELINQEFGLFLEVDKNLTQKAKVLYRGRGPWYFSDGLFTFSYDSNERKKLIDALFAQFYDVFEYYPKTVGAWWVDADALSYMQHKYGITSSLRAADQYDLDVYSIWGTPWSIPYIPSQENAGIPAETFDKGIPIVITQWAARDPFKAYGSTSEHGTFSIQDYELKQYDQTYFNHLSSNFLKEPGDQIVLGLENDGHEKTFIKGGHYNNLLTAASTLRDAHKVVFMTAKDYAEFFMKKKNVYPPSNYFLAKDYESDDQAFWYNSPNYRIGVQKIGDKISIIDLRDYRIKTVEDFSLLPNSQGMLRIYVPPVIDSTIFPNTVKYLASSDQPLSTSSDRDKVTLSSGDTIIGVFTDTSFTLSNASISLPTITNQDYFLPISVSLVIYGVYMIVMKKKLTKKDQVTLTTVYLIAFVFAADFHHTKDVIIFDKKMVYLSNLFPFIPISSTKVYVTFFIIPFLLFLIVHAFIIMRYASRKIFILAPAVMLILLYAHVPYFPLDKTTYPSTGIGLGVLGILSVLAAAGFYYKTKNKKIFVSSLLSIPVVLAIATCIIFFSRTRLIIPSFEIQALRTIEEKRKDVLYLYPTQKPIYKAIKPSLLDSYYVEEKLTGVNWTVMLRDGEDLSLQNYQNKLLIVPRFLGSTISDPEVKKLGLKKIFDNSQIAIFE